MSLPAWIAVYVLTSAVWVWLLIGGNAYRNSGSGFLIFLLRDAWGASYDPGCLRLVAWIALISETIVFIAGIADPSARTLWDLL